MHDLHPEAAADVGGDALHPVERQAQLGGDRRAHAGRGLGGGVDAQARVDRVPTGVHAAPLQRCGRAALHVEVELEGVRGVLDGGAGVPDVLHEVRRDVVVDALVHGVRRGPGGGDPDDRRQHVVAHHDAVAHVLGDVAVAGDDHDHRLTDVVDLLAGQCVAGARRVQRGVWNQQRQRFADATGQVLPGVDRDKTVDVQRGGHVDVDEPGVGVRAADECGGDRALVDIVGVAAAPGHQAQVLAALHRRPHAARRHDATAGPGSVSAARTSSAARRVALTMF